MIKAKSSYRAMVCVVCLLMVLIMLPVEAKASEGIWVYEKTVYLSQDGSRQWLDGQPAEIGARFDDGGYEIGRISPGRMEIDKNRPNRLLKNNPDKTTPEIYRLDFAWTQPPRSLQPGQTFSINMNRDVHQFQHGDWYPRIWANVHTGMLGTNLAPVYFSGPDAEEYAEVVWTEASWGHPQGQTEPQKRYVSMDSMEVTWTGKLPEGQPDQQRAIQIQIGHIAGTYYAERHLYNWQEDVSALTDLQGESMFEDAASEDATVEDAYGDNSIPGFEVSLLLVSITALLLWNKFRRNQ
ncbi:MAG: hypothetical protein QCH31_02175 [Methanolobus sp.]|nr:hypothetical protein [Methanolobus sp.]